MGTSATSSTCAASTCCPPAPAKTGTDYNIGAERRSAPEPWRASSNASKPAKTAALEKVTMQKASTQARCTMAVAPLDRAPFTRGRLDVGTFSSVPPDAPQAKCARIRPSAVADVDTGSVADSNPQPL